MSETWANAKQMVQKAQKKQKAHHDRTSQNTDFRVGDRVFVFIPAMKSGPAHKLACPYKGPYRIIELYPNGAELVLIRRPKLRTIRVALNRIRRCPDEVGEDAPTTETTSATLDQETETERLRPRAAISLETAGGPWRDRLQPRTTIARGRAN